MAIQVIQLQFMIRLEKGTRYFGMTSFMTITMFYTTFHRNEKKNTGLEEEVIALSYLK